MTSVSSVPGLVERHAECMTEGCVRLREDLAVSNVPREGVCSPRASRGIDWEAIARGNAVALPPSDYGSHRAIQDVARHLRAAYELGVKHGRATGSAQP